MKFTIFLLWFCLEFLFFFELVSAAPWATSLRGMGLALWLTARYVILCFFVFMCAGLGCHRAMCMKGTLGICAVRLESAQILPDENLRGNSYPLGDVLPCIGTVVDRCQVTLTQRP